MKIALSSLLVVVALALGGCGPKWVVVKQASPNPMASNSNFRIERPVFDPNFHVGDKTEQEWMSEKKAETQDKWDGDKAAMMEKFAEGFLNKKGHVVIAAAPGAGIFSVRARYVQYEPGFYAVVASAPTQLDADVEFLDATGNPVDVIRVHVKNGDFSSGGGARRCAEEIGALAAKYLKTRIGVDD